MTTEAMERRADLLALHREHSGDPGRFGNVQGSKKYCHD